MQAAILVDEQGAQDKPCCGIGGLDAQRGGRGLEAPYEPPVALGKIGQIPTQIDQSSGGSVRAEPRLEDQCGG